MSKTINSGDVISFAAKNWVAVKGKQTFLYAVQDLNWFGTDNNTTVADPGQNLPVKYQFKLIKCGGSGAINYGDRVNIESVSNKFIQCGSGNCNSGNNPSCNTNDWQVFTVVSPNRTSEPLAIGHTITLTQETGGKCSVLPADNSLIYCGSTINSNEYLTILLPNGTDGSSAEESQKKYDDKRDALLAQQNPSQANLEKASDFFGSLFTLSTQAKIAIGVVLAIIFLYLLSSIL